jgi:hypothetical protein
LGWSVIYPLIYPWIYGKTNTYPTWLKTKFITLFITLLFSFSFLLTLYLLYLAPTSIVEVYPCPRAGHCFEASHWFEGCISENHHIAYIWIFIFCNASDYNGLGWLIVEYIFFWCFIYVHYINDFEQNSYHMFSGPLWILLPSIIIEMNTLTSPTSS